MLMGSVFAVRIDQNTAFQTAETHLRAWSKTDFSIENQYQMLDDDGSLLAYVYHLDPAGFIIVSTDTDIIPVLGYSFRNNFTIPENKTNTGYSYVEGDLRLRLAAIPYTDPEIKTANNELWQQYQDGSISFANSRDTVWPPEGFSPTGGWVEVEWDQSPSPYNTFCPIDPSTNARSVTGCVATAMAQIMHYHRYIGSPVFTDADDYYSTYTNPPIYIDNDHLSLDFPSFPELNNYLIDAVIAYETGDPFTAEMIAATNFAAGVSVEMSYSSEASGAYSNDVAPAFIYKFGYDTATYVNYINTTFYTNLQNSIIDARPAYLGITSNSGGHAIIVDGWNQTTGNYHLNMGWGGSWNGWYSLPNGMPSGFTQVHSGVINIEGGTVPFPLTGMVFANNAPLDQTLLTLQGPRYYELEIDDPDGYFDIPYMHEGTYLATAVIELDGGGYYYKQESVEVDETNNTLIIYMDDFTALSGTVTAPVSAANAHINVYQNNILKTSGVADANGVFSIPGVLPGTYQAIASLNGNYFEERMIDVNVNNQTVHFDLEEYPYNHVLHFAGEPVDKFQFLNTMSVAIRLAEDDIADFGSDAVAKVSFMAPFNPEDGEIHAQLWRGSILISEKEVTNFVDGQWKHIVFDDFAVIDPAAEYYVGYHLSSLGGSIPAAWHDAGPYIPGKGGFVRTTNWLPLPGSFDFNLCIKGTIISQTPTSNDENTIAILQNQLGSNYPNPFNPTTTINFSIAADNFVKLEIYNVKGQMVRTLVAEDKSAGQHSVEWNGKDDNNRDVSSGIYFYKMQAGGRYTSTRKMIMLK